MSRSSDTGKKIIYHPLTEVGEIKNGERRYFEINGYSIIVFNISEKYFAIADFCSHDESPLDDAEIFDHVITCPRHGAQFDIKTGNALSLPAITGIPTYPLQINNGMLFVGLPQE